MGIFYYKQKKLISKTTAELYKKANLLSTNRFTEDWINICIGTIKDNLEDIFFGKKGESISDLKKNLNKLDKDRVYEIIKILVSFYMSFTKVNPSLSSILKIAKKEIGLKQKDFEDKIFSFFSFNSEDIEIFRELDNKYKQGTLSPIAIPCKISPSIGAIEAMQFRILLHTSSMGFVRSFDILLRG